MAATESGHDHGLRTNILPLQRRLPVIQEHGDDLLEVVVEFLKSLALAVCSRKPRDVANVEACIRATFHNGGVGRHGYNRGTPHDVTER